MRDFNHTVNVLVKAFFDGKLEHQNCAACAVGNIIADSINAVPATARELGFECDMKLWVREGHTIEPVWTEVFCSDGYGCQEKEPQKYRGYAKLQIDSTGYSWQELAKIEKAFERGYDWTKEPDDSTTMFNGLMNVLEVLADIHGISLEAKEKSKLLFVKL